MPEPGYIPWILLAVATLVAIAALFAWWRARTRPSRASVARNRTARAAESEAELLLAEHGFEVLERQVEQRWSIRVDGIDREVRCRADLLVERDNRLLVADVKSGSEAPDPALPATRRQLLEYLLVFAVDGVIVVDVPGARILEVDFSSLLERA